MTQVLEVDTVARVLGYSPSLLPKPATPLSWIRVIDQGLPVDALDSVAQKLAPEDTGFKFRLVPKATYTRRKQEQKLSAEEGLKVTRLAQVWGLAMEIWGSEKEARSFLLRPHAMLEDQTPMDMAIHSDIGADLVIDILNRLKYGVAP